MKDTTFSFPQLGRDWRIYMAISAGYCLAAICILQERLLRPTVPSAFGSDLIHFISLIAAYTAIDVIIILAGSLRIPLVILILEWLAFIIVLPPACDLFRSGAYLSGSIILFSRFLPIFSVSLLAEKKSISDGHGDSTINKHYYLLTAKIIPPIMVLSALIETLL